MAKVLCVTSGKGGVGKTTTTAALGAARNPRARIYCRKFEPELLGIDRLVRTAEDMGTALRGKAAQVWLDGGNIRMASLD